MTPRFTIVGLGEALFDLLPQGEVLGGAPLNVAVHAHQLAAAMGGRGVVVSRVGQDDRAQTLRQTLRDRGMTDDFIQSDPDHPTGVVYVDLFDPSSPSYDIVNDVAWDYLQFDPDLEGLAHQCRAVCFGSLAQRGSVSRDTIIRFLNAARHAVRLFDVNLRQDYYNSAILRRSCELATAVKLNAHEVSIVADALALRVAENTPGDGEAQRQAAALRKQYDLQFVALTRGERGTMLVTNDGFIEGAAARFDPAPNADAVGAGDACAAALLVGAVQRWPHQRTADLANRIGAYVATQPGATPKLPEDLLSSGTL